VSHLAGRNQEVCGNKVDDPYARFGGKYGPLSGRRLFCACCGSVDPRIALAERDFTWVGLVRSRQQNLKRGFFCLSVVRSARGPLLLSTERMYSTSTASRTRWPVLGRPCQRPSESTRRRCCAGFGLPTEMNLPFNSVPYTVHTGSWGDPGFSGGDPSEAFY